MKTESKLLYFDITDIVTHALAHERVTGIQRVVLNIIRNIVEEHGKRVRCIFYADAYGEVMECDPRGLFRENEFDSKRLMYKLGFVAGERYFPSKDDVRRYLSPYEGKKMMRKLKKLEVHVSSLLFPVRLRHLGLRRICDVYKGARRVPVRIFGGLKSGDSLIMLGSNWILGRVHELMRSHAQRGGDVVQMVYDLAPVRWPQYCAVGMRESFSRWLNETTQYPVRYLCISRHTADDLRVFLAEQGLVRSCEPVPLAHEFLGAARNTNLDHAPARLQSLHRRPYVLCVGTIEIRKNGAMLLRAWLRLHKELGERLPLLVFAGRHGWKTEQFDELLEQHKALRGVTALVHSPSDAELVYLYSNCLFTVFPSLGEGWGLPVGEAAWFGKFCLASDATSIPEVCGDLIEYVDPADEEGWVDQLRRFILDPGYVHAREKAIAAAPLRSWRDVAEHVMRAISDNEPRITTRKD